MLYFENLLLTYMMPTVNIRDFATRPTIIIEDPTINFWLGSGLIINFIRRNLNLAIISYHIYTKNSCLEVEFFSWKHFPYIDIIRNGWKIFTLSLRTSLFFCRPKRNSLSCSVHCKVANITHLRISFIYLTTWMVLLRERGDKVVN